MKAYLIYGGGAHALVVRDILEQTSELLLSAIVVDENYANAIRPDLNDVSLCGPADLPRLRDTGIAYAVVAIGDNVQRMRIAAKLRQLGFHMINAVHPKAVVAESARIESGAVIAAGAVVGVNAQLGIEVIVNTSASVDHDCVVGDGCHICPGAVLAGAVTIGAGAMIGTGSVIIERLRIGAGSVIGAGAVVVRDIPEGVIAYGVPARQAGPVRH